MATVTLSSSISALQGKLDGWVYRTVNGQTIVTPHRPAKNSSPSAAQADRRERFRAAQAYAAEVLADRLRRRVYQKLGAERRCPPNALLISNFLTPPVIEAIELDGYTGAAGEQIQILATDAIEVTAVTMRILAADGTSLESGPATPDHGVWRYRTTTALAPGTSARIEVTARNRANACATQTISRP